MDRLMPDGEIHRQGQRHAREHHMHTDDMGRPALRKGDSVAGPHFSGRVGVKKDRDCLRIHRHSKVLSSLSERRAVDRHWALPLDFRE
jgi:hypothetical protein